MLGQKAFLTWCLEAALENVMALRHNWQQRGRVWADPVPPGALPVQDSALSKMSRK